ncbi:2-amino-4-hydroxy-6-hydroxymethyldihydropteridine diphosphokinase [Acinetobacter nectaris]|nr:2-amino-4-hydroxy-6-hydroxymethyldihydropteridine diphosphokinase [Acinetobacter nectaris]
MNANEMTFALALASNLNAQNNLTWALEQLMQYGNLTLSRVFQIPCRDDVGEDYLNCACLLRTSNMNLECLNILIKALEQDSGRVRPSHQISLDIDLIAWKNADEKESWQFNVKKMPFALDVKIPLSELIQHPTLMFQYKSNYRTVFLPLQQCIKN